MHPSLALTVSRTSSAMVARRRTEEHIDRCALLWQLAAALRQRERAGAPGPRGLGRHVPLPLPQLRPAALDGRRRAAGVCGPDAHMRTHTRARTHARMHARKHTHTHTHTHTHINFYERTHAHTHTHAPTPTLTLTLTLTLTRSHSHSHSCARTPTHWSFGF